MAKESTFKSLVLTLLIITLVASSALAFVYQLTLKPIEMVKAAKKNDAIQQVVPAFDNQPTTEVITLTVDGSELNIYPAKKGGKLVGAAVESFTNKGFGGEIKVMVGLLPDGSINKALVTEHKETPGLGDKLEPGKSGFSLQFEGKNPADFKLSVRKDGGDVDAITASTISSRAFCDAVNRACKAFNENKTKFENQ